MNRYWLFLVTLGLMVGCQPFPCTDQVCPDYYLEFALTGGFAGVSHRLILNEDGTVEARDKGFLVSSVITSEDREVWQGRLNQVYFFDLDDDYPPATVIIDGFSYKLTVTSQGQTKTVAAADRGGHPDDLHELFWDLYYDLYAPVYRDSATVGTVLIWQRYIVQPWPFTTEAPLRDQVYTEYIFVEIDSTGEIERYINALYYPDGNSHTEIHYLHQEDDSLYMLTLRSDGFYIKSVHPVRYWPADLNIPLSGIIDEGVIVQAEVYQEVKALLIEPLFINSIFIEAPADEDVVAYYVTLRNGVYVGWP